jgi:predicted branched-subunit amino acid permease
MQPETKNRIWSFVLIGVDVIVVVIFVILLMKYLQVKNELEALKNSSSAAALFNPFFERLI